MTPTLARTHGRVDALLARMTLREKIGQMTQAEKNSATPPTTGGAAKKAAGWCHLSQAETYTNSAKLAAWDSGKPYSPNPRIC